MTRPMSIQENILRDRRSNTRHNIYQSLRTFQEYTRITHGTNIPAVDIGFATVALLDLIACFLPSHANTLCGALSAGSFLYLGVGLLRLQFLRKLFQKSAPTRKNSTHAAMTRPMCAQVGSGHHTLSNISLSCRTIAAALPPLSPGSTVVAIRNRDTHSVARIALLDLVDKSFSETMFEGFGIPPVVGRQAKWSSSPNERSSLGQVGGQRIAFAKPSSLQIEKKDARVNLGLHTPLPTDTARASRQIRKSSNI